MVQAAGSKRGLGALLVVGIACSWITFGRFEAIQGANQFAPVFPLMTGFIRGIRNTNALAISEQRSDVSYG